MDPNWRNHAHPLPTAVTTADGSRAGVGSTAAATSPYQSRVVNADTKFIVANRPGEALFAKACAVCHTIGEGIKVGPDLDGLTARRSRPWLIDLFTNPEKLRARQDPTILSLMAKFPTVRMPFLQINETDAADLIAYIDARSSRRAPTIALKPLYALTTQDGTHLASADLEGRPFAVVFGYTHCPDVCPTTLLQWTNLLRSAGVAANEFKVLFVSVDSERDTPAVLKSYLASFDSRITALTGSPSQIANVAEEFGAHYAKVAGEHGNYTYDHTVQRYLIDRDGRLAGVTDLQTAEAEQRKMFARLLADDHLKEVRR
jgi:protein SCO1/2